MKRERFLWPLTQSHHRGLMAARRVKERLSDCDPGQEADRIEEASLELRGLYEAELKEHFWDEERILGLYEGHMGRLEPEPERIRKEHRLLESLMGRKDRMSLLRFAETLVAHIRFEEDELFGLIEGVLTDDEKEEVARILTGTPGSETAGNR